MKVSSFAEGSLKVSAELLKRRVAEGQTSLFSIDGKSLLGSEWMGFVAVKSTYLAVLGLNCGMQDL